MSIGEQANMIKDRGHTVPKPTPAFNYSLEEASLSGFVMAVNNGQTRLALEYAARVLAEQEERITELEKQLEESSTTKATASSTTSTTSSAKKPARVVDEKAESTEV